MSTFGDVRFHAMLLRDANRCESYRRAIHQIVRQGDVVLDVGSGSGILGLFAAQAGARKVYCVERTGMVTVAQALARENGFADRMEFLKSDIFEVALPEKADVVVSELMSRTILGQRQEGILAYCRDHLMKPGGRSVPAVVQHYVAALDLMDFPVQAAAPESGSYGLRFSAMEEMLVIQPHSMSGGADYVVSDHAPLYAMDFENTKDTSAISGEVRLRMIRDCAVSALLIWFEARLARGIFIETLTGSGSWRNVLLRLKSPVRVMKDEEIFLRFKISAENDASPLLHWWVFAGDSKSPGRRQVSAGSSVFAEGPYVKDFGSFAGGLA